MLHVSIWLKIDRCAFVTFSKRELLCLHKRKFHSVDHKIRSLYVSQDIRNFPVNSYFFLIRKCLL